MGSPANSSKRRCRALPCKCAHPHQDKVYGQGKRAHNPTGGGSGESPIYRCTVCSTERSA
jgi:hypothetical protein